MIHYTIAPGTTDITLTLFIPDASSSVGDGLTGLVFNSSSLVCYYVRPPAAAIQIALITQTTTGAHSDGGFVEMDATNMPGIYRIDLPDTVCAAGAASAFIILEGAANMVPALVEIGLISAIAAGASSGAPWFAFDVSEWDSRVRVTHGEPQRGLLEPMDLRRVLAEDEELMEILMIL